MLCWKPYKYLKTSYSTPGAFETPTASETELAHRWIGATEFQEVQRRRDESDSSVRRSGHRFGSLIG